MLHNRAARDPGEHAEHVEPHRTQIADTGRRLDLRDQRPVQEGLGRFPIVEQRYSAGFVGSFVEQPDLPLSKI
jgi:hypothetical protein